MAGRFFLFLLCVTGMVSAEPVTRTLPCSFCGGKRGPVSLTPPNLGQFDGEIGVTPGKPFANHRFDVKVAQCPICTGLGRRTLWQFAAPSAAVPEGWTMCPTCWRAGVEKCRTCHGQGVVACRACASQARGGKPGWIKTEKPTGGKRSHHKKLLVTPCATCEGFGQVPCAACDGRGGAPCRTCRGAGLLPTKGRP